MNLQKWYIACIALIAMMVLSVVSGVHVTKAQTATNQTPMATITPTPSPQPSSTPLPVATLVALEQKIDELQNSTPPKDIWDKIDSISGLVSGLAIAVVGAIATLIYRNREMALANAQKKREFRVLEVQTVASFIPHLRSGDEKTIEAALLAIAALGNTELSTRLANLYQSSGAVAAISKIASGEDAESSQQAAQSLQFLREQFIQRVARLMKQFSGQRVSGKYFSSQSDVILPVIEKVELDLPNADIRATGQTETWLVKIDFNMRPSFQDVIEHINWTETKSDHIKLWRIIVRGGGATSKIPNLLLSFLSDVEELEKELYA